MPFVTEPAPAWGEAVSVAPGIRRVVARNAGPMTYHGTNTYMIDSPDGLVVLDPGPDDPAHVQAVLHAGRGEIAHILLSHTHADHLGGAPALRAATGAPVHAWHAPAVAFEPDVPLHDGDLVAGLIALHTPGHASDHLCFAAPGHVLFSADHVMGWSTTVVSPPGGDMADYMRSLERLMARADTLYLPGHGPPIADPLRAVEERHRHRLAREAAIVAALAAGPSTAGELTVRLYDVGPDLRRAAERNVVAHLLKLERENRAYCTEKVWRLTPSTSVAR